MRCTGTEDSPRRELRSRPSRPFPDSRQDALQRLFPSGKTALHLIAVQAFENVAAQTQPGGVWVMRVDHVFPGGDRQPVCRFLAPRDLRDLHSAAAALVKDGAAEK